MILTEIDSLPWLSLPASLEERRYKRRLPAESIELEELVKSSRRSKDPEKRTLALALALRMALQADDLRILEDLRTSGAEVRAIVANLLTALITIDEKGRIQAANPAAEEMFGYAFEDMKARSVSMLMPSGSHEKAMAMLSQIYFKGMSSSVELQGRRKNGQLFPCELMMFETGSGQGRRFTGNLRDLTHKKAVERLQTDLVSIVSHELRTPLTSIRGSLTLIGTGAFGHIPEEAAELVEIAERNCIRLIQLVGDILDLERLENSEMALDMTATPLATVIERGLEGVRGYAAEKKIGLEIGESAGTVWANSARLVQVLVNLLSNAIKFSPPGGTVHIWAVERGDTVEVRVADRGRGIPRHFLQSIFERFGQVQTSDAREKGGTGLGLAICKSIVAKHSGQIGVESEEGKGSTFFFWIPKSPLAPAPAQPSIS